MLERAAVALLCVVAAVACGDDAASTADAGPFENMCPAPREQAIQCVAPGEVLQGSELPATFDEDGCQIMSEVKNSCCNPAVAGPERIDGRCCYAFCEGVCC